MSGVLGEGGASTSVAAARRPMHAQGGGETSASARKRRDALGEVVPSLAQDALRREALCLARAGCLADFGAFLAVGAARGDERLAGVRPPALAPGLAAALTLAFSASIRSTTLAGSSGALWITISWPWAFSSMRAST